MAENHGNDRICQIYFISSIAILSVSIPDLTMYELKESVQQNKINYYSKNMAGVKCGKLCLLVK